MTISMLEPRALPVQLFVLWIITSRVWAIPWEGPRATGVTDYGVGTTPLPTGTSNDLVKRGQYPITVCGFIAGDLGMEWLRDSHNNGEVTNSGQLYRLLALLGHRACGSQIITWLVAVQRQATLAPCQQHVSIGTPQRTPCPTTLLFTLGL